MKYMVMECYPGYAVVLDENGSFSKVANMRYEVGQTITDVVPLQVSVPQTVSTKKRNVRWLYSLAAVAACLLLVLLPSLMPPQVPYASVYMTINPEVRIDVNQNDIVVGLEGVNADGVTLIEGYEYQEKDLDLVVDELVDRAIDMGFLHEGGKVTLTLDAEDDEWVVSHSDSLEHHLNEHLEDKMSVTIEVCNKHSQSTNIPIETDDDDDDDYDDQDDDDDHSGDHDDSDDDQEDDAGDDQDDTDDDTEDDDDSTDPDENDSSDDSDDTDDSDDSDNDDTDDSSNDDEDDDSEE